MNISDNFTSEEVICKCGCGTSIVDQRLLVRLQIARDIAKIPFRIHSWTRCVAHNKAVGGREDSEHLTGEAVDIDCPSPWHRHRILRALVLVGFPRIGIGANFIHAGISKSKAPELIYLY